MNRVLEPRLAEIYRRERLTFLQYVIQATPFADEKDRPILERVRELAKSESDELDRFAEYLDRNHVALPRVGAFPSSFTNYNFVTVRKLLPNLIKDESRGLQTLEHEVASLPSGDERALIEGFTAAKRLRLNELEKLTK